MKKRYEWYEGRKVGQKLGFVFLIIWVVCLFFSNKAMGATLKIENDRGFAIDSVYYILYNGTVNEATNISSPRLDSVRYDTTFTVDSSQTYILGFFNRLAGVDSLDVELYVIRPTDTTGVGTSDTLRLPMHWWVPTDSARLKVYKDGFLFNTGSWKTGVQSYDTSVIVDNSEDMLYVFELAYTGLDDPVDWAISIPPVSLGGSPVDLEPSPGTWVTAYIDVGTGGVDSVSGLWVTRTKTLFKLNLLGGDNYSADDILFLPTEQRKRPDINGRVSFRVAANTAINPPTSYYELSYQALDGRTRREMVIKRFILDSIPDPVNILDATEIW